MEVLSYLHFNIIMTHSGFALPLLRLLIAAGQATSFFYYNMVFSNWLSSRYNHSLGIFCHLNLGRLFHNLLSFLSSLLQYIFFVLAERASLRNHKNLYVLFHVSYHQLVYLSFCSLYCLRNRFFLLILFT